MSVQKWVRDDVDLTDPEYENVEAVYKVDPAEMDTQRKQIRFKIGSSWEYSTYGNLQTQGNLAFDCEFCEFCEFCDFREEVCS